MLTDPRLLTVTVSVYAHLASLGVQRYTASAFVWEGRGSNPARVVAAT